jgi:hypothetical protein
MSADKLWLIIVKEKNKEKKKYNFQHSKCPDSPALDLSPLFSLPSGNSAQTAGLIKHSPAFRVCYFSLSAAAALQCVSLL